MTVAVVGCGFLGLLLIQLLKAAGCEVIALSRRDFSLEKAKQLGADHILPMKDHDQIIRQVQKLTRDRLCNRTIECTGKEWPLNLAIEDRKSTRLNSSHVAISYAVFCLKKKNKQYKQTRSS